MERLPRHATRGGRRGRQLSPNPACLPLWGGEPGGQSPLNRILRQSWVTPVPLCLLPGGDRGHGHPRGAHQTRAPVASPQSHIPAAGREAGDRWRSQEGRVDSQQDLWPYRWQHTRPPNRGRQVSKAATAGKQERQVRGDATCRQSQAGVYSPTQDPPCVSALRVLTWQPPPPTCLPLQRSYRLIKRVE